MRTRRFLLAATTTLATLAAAATAPQAAADTSSNPAGISSTGSVASVLNGGGVGLGELNRTITSSYGLTDTHAPTGGATVLVFGDSHTGGTIVPLYTDDRGCMHSRHSWPNQLAGLANLRPGELIDGSCWGSGINTGHGIPLADQVRYAESLGGLGPNTTDIVIQMGFNDTWSGYGVTMLETAVSCVADRAHCNDAGIAAHDVINPADITADSWAERVKPVTDYLRYYAPNATIHVMGYQSLTPSGDVCVSLFGRPTPLRGTALLGQLMRSVDAAARGGAEKLGLDFLDLRQATAGHESCSASPWVDGVFDPRADLGGVVAHPSTEGNHAAAELVHRAMTRPAAPATAAS